MSDKELIDYAINRFICFYDEQEKEPIISNRLRSLIESFLESKINRITDVDYSYYIEKLGRIPTIPINKSNYIVAIGENGQAVMGAY